MSAPIFTVDSNHPAVIRILPVQAKGFLIHYVKEKPYACPKFNDRFKIEKCHCPICDERAKLYRDADAATDPNKKQDCTTFARILRPLERYYVPMIDRAHPENGVQVLSVSKSLYKIILQGILEHPCPPPKPKWYHFWTRLKNWWRSYKQPASALDELEGVDFIVRREMKAAMGMSFPDYSASKFASKTSPIGTPEEIAYWKLQAELVLGEIKIPSVTELSGEHPIE